MNNPLAKDFTFSSLLHFAFPTIVMMLFMGLYTIVDTIFVSQFVNTFALSALNIVCPVINIIVGIGTMIATGGSASAAITNIKARGAKDIRLVCLVGAPEGVKVIEEDHPDVELILATLDEKLNEKGYIVPGLGDAGDRLFGTD